MTDIQSLSKLAIRTESIVPDLNGQTDNLKKALELVSIAGGILDQVKRSIYYGAKGAYNPDKLNALTERLLQVEPFEFTGPEMISNSGSREIPNVNTRVIHGIVGAITETAELADAALQYLNTGAFDAVNLIEEIADVEWYTAVLQDELDFPLEGLYQFLIAKLAVRYGDKFSDEQAVLRDIGSERDVMERFLKAQAEVQ